MPVVSLLVVSCDGCGACCQHVGAPPALWAEFIAAAARGETPELDDTIDGRMFRDMPDAARRELTDYYAELSAGRTADRRSLESPCLWYDPDSRRCRWHDWRPKVCREFEVGCHACLVHRERIGLAAVP